MFDLPTTFVEDWVDSFNPVQLNVLIDKNDLANELQMCHKLFLDLQRKGPTRIILPPQQSLLTKSEVTMQNKKRNFILVLSDTEEVVSFIKQVRCRVTIFYASNGKS